LIDYNRAQPATSTDDVCGRASQRRAAERAAAHVTPLRGVADQRTDGYLCPSSPSFATTRRGVISPDGPLTVQISDKLSFQRMKGTW
jgi:hypothetical protein